MGSIPSFGTTADVAITVLVDNSTDLIIKSTETVKRFEDDALLAEHGFAALIKLREAGVTILWDAGLTDIALPENMRRMELDPATIDIITLSHGHGDHTGAMTEVIRSMGRRPKSRKWEKDTPTEDILEYVQGHPVPLVAHPAALRERWGKDDDGNMYGPAKAALMQEWEAAGAAILLSAGPYELGPGCWTTGAVPRRSFESAGRSGHRYYREGNQFLHDDLDDDQAIVINVRQKGLVVVAGCAHAGIVNTVSYAQEISGTERVWAILGGFHLAPAGDAEIQRTINAIKELAPAMVVPTHCTGFRAVSEFARQMPEQFVLGTVGATYLF